MSSVKTIGNFISVEPTLENYWRSIILFGRNVASYKLALAKSLLELSTQNGTLITLEQLASPFSRYLTEHLKTAPKQATSQSSRYLDACRRFNQGVISQKELIDLTIKLGFNNVIDAFHIVNQNEIGVRFFIDERRQHGAIRLTDEFLRLLESPAQSDLATEAEARWRLVETAWGLSLSRNLVAINYDPTDKMLFASQIYRRTSITSCRDALNGYQKGRCFYCFRLISIADDSCEKSDVDHFFPHVLKGYGTVGPIDGVWNLVLACRECNRGESGKFARVPSLSLLERLFKRNNYLISSHHPLRETLILQTGTDAESRRAFHQRAHIEAKAILIHEWEPKPRGPDYF